MNSLGRPSNNFDGLRLIAAIAVVIGHAYVLTGAGPAPMLLGFPIHKLGVAVFFCISGYLIAGSWFRVQSTPRYLWHRFLRVVPALWAVVLLTVFVIGPLVSRLPANAYFQSSDTYDYLINLTTAATYRLPGVFEDHVTPAVNGSLWTIGVEVVCYLTLLIIALCGRRFAGGGFALVACLAAVASFTVATKNGALPGLADAAPVIVYFFIGAVMKTMERKLEIRWKIGYAIAGIALWGGVFLLFPGGTLYASWVLLPLCVIPIGRLSWTGLRSGSRFGDISYGVYLWGFPIQQIMIQILGPVDLLLNTTLVLGITFAIAALSCHLIERPALKWKDWTPEVQGLMRHARLADPKSD